LSFRDTVSNQDTADDCDKRLDEDRIEHARRVTRPPQMDFAADLADLGS
jgi:hypothetical protein